MGLAQQRCTHPNLSLHKIKKNCSLGNWQSVAMAMEIENGGKANPKFIAAI